MQKSLNYGYYIIFTVSEVRRRGHDPALQWRMEFGTLNYNLPHPQKNGEGKALPCAYVFDFISRRP